MTKQLLSNSYSIYGICRIQGYPPPFSPPFSPPSPAPSSTSSPAHPPLYGNLTAPTVLFTLVPEALACQIITAAAILGSLLRR